MTFYEIVILNFLKSNLCAYDLSKKCSPWLFIDWEKYFYVLKKQFLEKTYIKDQTLRGKFYILLSLKEFYITIKYNIN